MTTDSIIKSRDNWNKLKTAKSRSAYIRGEKIYRRYADLMEQMKSL